VEALSSPSVPATTKNIYIVKSAHKLKTQVEAGKREGKCEAAISPKPVKKEPEHKKGWKEEERDINVSHKNTLITLKFQLRLTPMSWLGINFPATLRQLQAITGNNSTGTVQQVY
jgi:hypothetical protein